MGSWNATCHLSNLPIRRGEKVVVIVYTEKDSYEATKGYYNYYPNSCFTPFLPPIYGGVYDDYGRINGENLEENNKIVLDCIKCFNFIQSGKEIIFDSIFDFISKLERADSQQEDIYLHYDTACFGFKDYKIKFAMYHADIYFGLLEAWKEKIEFRKTEEKLKGYFEAQGSGHYIPRPQGVFYIENIINDYVFLDIPKTDELISRIVDIENFTSILGNLRKGYACITGCGSQSENYEFQFFLNSLIRRHIIECMKDSLADWCDDEEFNQKHDLENNEVTDEIAIEYMEKHKTDTW